MKHKFHPGLRVLAVGVITIAALLTFAGAVLAATLLVDHFDSGGQSLPGEIPAVDAQVVVSGTATGTMLGGERDILITGTAPIISETFSIKVITAQTGRLSIATDPDVTVKAHVEWDGVDGNAQVLNPVGLGGVDLTDGGSNTAFHLNVTFDDLPVLVSLKVYSGTNWFYYNLNLPGGILTGSRVDFTIPFNDFLDGGGTGVRPFASAGAIVMDIDTSASPGADVTMQFLQLDAAQDFGDLPAGYGTLLINNGPRHTGLTGLRLGSNVDSEPDGQPNATATGDDINQAPPNDEDGVTRGLNGSNGPNWTPGTFATGAGGSVNVMINGPMCNSVNLCYLRGWIDWNNNGTLEPSEMIINASLGTTVGTQRFTFDVPNNPNPVCYTGNINQPCYARFRLCGGVGGAQDCNSPLGPSTTGEVEDYAWGFGTTAVTLESLQAQPTTSPVLPVALLGVSAASLVGIVFLTRRGRRKAA